VKKLAGGLENRRVNNITYTCQLRDISN